MSLGVCTAHCTSASTCVGQKRGELELEEVVSGPGGLETRHWSSAFQLSAPAPNYTLNYIEKRHSGPCLHGKVILEIRNVAVEL